MSNIHIKIKTPIWTGNIDQKSELLQSTGIMGSFRWWTEAILRGIGKYVCDPTREEGCPKEDKNKKYYCSACLIFGATGIRRTFRVYIDGGKSTFSGSAINIKPSRRKRGWYLGSGIVGEMYLEITSLDRDFDESLVLLPLVIASNWGGIGAKTQHGYGVVKVENYPEISFKKFKNAIEKLTNENRLSKLGIGLQQKDNDALPNLKEMFFAKIQFEANNEWWRNVDGIKEALEPKDKKGNLIKDLQERNQEALTSWFKTGSVPIASAIKNWLRFGNERKLWETGNKNQDAKIESWLFGTTNRVCSTCYGEVKRDKKNPQNFWCPNCKKSLGKEETFERIASKIHISSAYVIDYDLWEFRIWGWVPKKGLPAGFNRDKFLNNLKRALSGSGPTTVPWNKLLSNQTKNHKLKVWREFNSPRDDIMPNESNVENYIQSLLRNEVK